MTRTRGVLGPETLSHLRWIDLPYGNVIRPNAAHGVNFRVRLTGNATLEPPLNPRDGQPFCLRIEQDGTGGRTLTLHSAWNTVGLTAQDTSANGVTYWFGTYNGQREAWDFTGTSEIALSGYIATTENHERHYSSGAVQLETSGDVGTITGLPTSGYRVRACFGYSPTGATSSATVQIRTASGGGGDVLAQAALSSLTAAEATQALGSLNTQRYTGATAYVYCSVGAGSAATAKFSLEVLILA